MKALGVFLLGLLVMGVFANQALAGTSWTRDGYIKVCKQSTGSPAATGNFQFTVNDNNGAQTVVVAVGSCSDPIAVTDGTDSVTENGSLSALDQSGAVSSSPSTSYITASASAVGANGPTGSFSGFTESGIAVPVSSDGTLGTVTVTFTDSINQGYMEVCKTVLDPNLTGQWTFSVSGGNSQSATETVAAGSCSGPFLMPIGYVKVQETGDLAENVTMITATRTAAKTSYVWSPNLATQTVVTNVVAPPSPGDTSNETLVTFQNNSVALEICKTLDGGLTNTGPYTFNWTDTGPSGYTGTPASGSVKVTANTSKTVCSSPVYFRAGQTIAISEVPTVGSKVESIGVSPTGNYVSGAPFTGATVAGTNNPVNGTVSVVLGPGDTIVTYENEPALAGALKICKVGDSTIKPGTLFPFTIGSTTVTVPSGTTSAPGCNTVPGTFAYDSAQTITEGTVSGITTAVTGFSVNPGFVAEETGTGVWTPTNQNSTMTSSTATRSITVLVGENNTTIVTFSNTDPPSNSGGGGSGGGGSSGGGSSSGGSSSSGGGSSTSSTSSSTSLTGSVGTLVTPTGTGLGVSTGTAGTTSASLTNALKLSKLEKQLKSLQNTEKILNLRIKTVKSHSVKLTLMRQLARDKANAAKVQLEIKKLK